MLRLHLLRHADAGDPGAYPGPDAERPLSEKGRRQAERLGRLLAATGFEPDAIITSPRVRAAETAEIVAAALGRPVRVDDRLGGGLALSDVAGVLEDAGSPSRPVLVGHDPDFSSILSDLVGTDVAMKKGAIAAVDVSSLQPGAGRLQWLLPPSVLPRS